MQELRRYIKKCITILLLLISKGTLLSVARPTYIFLPTTKFASSFPYITGDTWRKYCDHILDAVKTFNPLQVKSGDTIFVMVNFLEHFFTEYHSKIVQPYILVTHHFFDMSDYSVPGVFEPYLDDPKIIAWFTHNVSRGYHPKLHPIPIGIANAHYSYGNKKEFDIALRNNRRNRAFRKKLLYMNFSIHTCPQERQLVYDMFVNKPFCTVANNKDLGDYLKDLAQHKFALSPRGNGLDCFRTWEALLMGCYPIVRTSTLDSVFEDLPVLIVKDWSEVTEEFLEQKYQEMSGKIYTWKKLYMPYWLQKIKEIQNRKGI